MSKTQRKYKDKVYQDKDSRNRKIARSCLNHGDCPWCQSSREYRTLKRVPLENDIALLHNN